jgi:hypothetical protein
MEMMQNHAQLAVATDSMDSYKVTLKRGNISGVGASVSGAGAWVKLKGEMDFSTKRLETSKTYNEIKNKYKIGGGVSAFWSWIGLNVKGEKEKEEITKTFHELQQSQEVKGRIRVNMQVSGQYPNVQVDASAYVLVFEVEDKQGNKFHIASSGDPQSDIGAQDSSGNALPNKDNNSTITL